MPGGAPSPDSTSTAPFTTETSVTVSLHSDGKCSPSDASLHASPSLTSRPPFPSTVSFNILLHAIARSASGAPNRQQKPLSSLAAVRRELAAGRYTRADAISFFRLVWRRLCEAGTPSAASWAIRALFFAQLEHEQGMHDCMRAMVAAGACSTASVNTALGAYAARHRDASADLCAVYEALRYNQLLDELRRVGHAARPPAQSDPAVRRVLGVDAVPPDVLPDRATYALLVRLLTQRGDLSGALRVLHDMVVTPSAPPTTSLPRPYVSLGESDAHGMAPSVDVYHAFFSAFAKYGVPADVRQRGAAPHEWEWAAPDTLWNVHTLAELFEGYLRVDPLHTPPRRSRRRPSQAPAPTPHQLYQVLLALQRVGHGHHAWVCAQWRRLVAKFDDPSHWYDFRVDARLAASLAALGCPIS